MNRREAALKEICEQFGISILYVFGSQAENVRQWVEGQIDRLPDGPADVDIGVKGIAGERWSVRKKVDLAGAMEVFFGCPRVDLVFLQEADPFLAAEIIRGERLFSRDEYEADEYDLYVLRRAGDLAPLEQERMALVLGELP
jgi:hypothetical protein